MQAPIPSRREIPRSGHCASACIAGKKGSIMLELNAAEREERLFALERIRAPWTGILETANTTFLLLIAERYYHSEPAAKSILQSNASVGLLLTPVILTWAAGRGQSAGGAAARLYLWGALAIIAAAVSPWQWGFIAGAFLAFVSVASAIPLSSCLYEAHYPAARRGALFSRTIVLRIIGSVGFACVGGWALTFWPHAWRVLLGVYALALLAASRCLARSPTAKIPTSEGTHPLRALRHVRLNPRFRWTLASWMLLGFANLVMFPLRIDYLANPTFGLQLPPERIALLTSVIPNIARLLFTRAWGHLFDRMNFFRIRILLNTGFMLGILSFFTGASTLGLFTGAILFGISNAGADLVWNLWATKIAPPGLATEYMAVHTFLTGLRGIVAPFFAFYMAPAWGIAPTAGLMAALIAIASLMLWKEARPDRAPQQMPMD